MLLPVTMVTASHCCVVFHYTNTPQFIHSDATKVRPSGQFVVLEGSI